MRPNVVVIYTDQLRWDALGCTGNADVVSPNLDRLAERGALFDHHFVQSPVCMPSRVSMLSGRYPSDLRITHMGVPVPQDVTILPGYLRRFGFRSANLGKLHFLPHANRDHRSPHPDYGFDVLELSDEPGVYDDDYRQWVRARDPEAVDAVGAGWPPAAATWVATMSSNEREPIPRDDYAGPVAFPADEGLTHAAFVADRTIDFVERSVGREPFLAVASFFAPHAPFVVPQRFLDLYERDSLTIGVRGDPALHSTDDLRRLAHGYYASISEVDHHVGRILDSMEELGILDDTIVVFTSDHGEWLGDRGRLAKGYPADDPVSRVPLIVAGPGIVPGVRPGIVESVDIVPTVLELCGAALPDVVQGRSLVEQLRTAGDGPIRDSALTEHHGWKSLRTEDHRYVVHADGTERLWDLRADPSGGEDVAGEPASAEVLAELRRALLARMIATERPAERTWPY